MSQLYAVASVTSSSSTPTCDCLAHRFGNAADHQARTRRYLSDMTDAEWATVRAALPTPGWLDGRGGRPESYCHRQMIDAIRYLVDNGIKWRAVPADFPPWHRVYVFFRRWRDHALIHELHDRLRDRVRTRQGRTAQPTAGIIDSQSVKADATVKNTSRGFDGGKKINGRKRHLLVDTHGLLLTTHVTPAATTDREAARTLLPTAVKAHPTLQLIWADGAYTGPLTHWATHQLGVTLEIIKRNQDTTGFTVLPRRWAIERTFAWLMRSRRLVRDFETHPTSSHALILWSMTMLISRRLSRTTSNAPTPAT